MGVETVAHQWWFTLIIGVVVIVGLAGVVVPILPGVVLIFAAVAVWAWAVGGTTAWVVFGIATALLVVSGVVKYLWPGRRLHESGVPTSTVLFGGIGGIVGFFVIPVIGILVGFVLGVYLAEWYRLGKQRPAWESSKAALQGVGLSILVELLGALLASGVWLVGVFLT